VTATPYRITSPSTEPTSGAARLMGSDRNRSNTPFLMSRLMLRPVARRPVSRADITSTPGKTYCRYSRGEPATAPPKR
jgi:hypothetical protein